ncbi:MAG TPA: 3'-5' exonuclease [Dissulfurispiraceae bacterium]|nr:3'-5' exonuclease [Dissulfurispiraceae bacterium]
MDLLTARFYAIDVETTGLDQAKDEIISFACVPIVNLKIIVRENYYTLIKPARYNYKAMKYHGISRTDLQAAPTFEDVSDHLLKMLDGILVGHTVEFDFNFLKKSFKASGLKFKKDLIDIAMVEKWLTQRCNAEGRGLTLDDMIEAYGLKRHYRHNAAADAFFAAQIFQMQMLAMMKFGIDSAEKVIKAARSCRYANSDTVC